MKKTDDNEETEEFQMAVFSKDRVIATRTLESAASLMITKNKQGQFIKLHKFITSELGEMVMVFQQVLDKAITELGFEELRMLNYLLSVCDFENLINISQSVMAIKLKTKQSSISRAINNLKSKHYIIVVKKDGRNYYKINPEAAWKGYMTDLKSEIVDINTKKERKFK